MQVYSQVMMSHKITLLFLMLVSFALLLSDAYAEIRIEPTGMQKNSIEIIVISGFANDGISAMSIVLEFPDGTVQHHTAAVGRNNTFTYYINPGEEFPSGTYLVKVHSTNDSSKKILVGTGAFNIYDSEESFDFVINRGASTKSCDGCIHPADTRVYQESVLRWHNNDSAIHEIKHEKSKSKEFVGTLKPGESRSIHATTTGNITYHCTIHPWIHGKIAVVANKFDFPIITLDEIPETRIDKTTEIAGMTPKINDRILGAPESIPETFSEKTEEIPCDSCFGGVITKIVDGDTLDIDGKRIRLALVDTPERGEVGYTEATNFLKDMCPLGSIAFYSIDKRQPVGPYGRIIAEVFCDGMSLNQNIVEKNYGVIHTRYCDSSDFASSVWAAKQCGIEISDNTTKFSFELEDFITDNITDNIVDKTTDNIVDAPTPADNITDSIADNIADNITDNITDDVVDAPTPPADNLTNNITDSIAEIFSEVASKFTTLQNNESDLLDPNNSFITLAQIIVIACIGIIIVIIFYVKKRD